MAQYQFTVQTDDTLLVFLLARLAGRSRTTVKSYLSHRQVSVNHQITTQFNEPLHAGDTVTVSTGRGPEELRHPMLRIVFEDAHLIVIDKRHGLLSMGTDREREKTAYYILSAHVKRSDPDGRIFIIHRLDRETSGLMMFAKSQQVQEAMQRNWTDRVLERRYVAVVEGHLPRPEGIIDAPLAENKGLKVFVSNEGQSAVTRYRTLRAGEGYTLVELSLDTGRKNQIRAHMEHICHSVAGDRKYGAATDPAGRVLLHARQLRFLHPVTGEELDFRTAVPALFESVLSMPCDAESAAKDGYSPTGRSTVNSTAAPATRPAAKPAVRSAQRGPKAPARAGKRHKRSGK
ncbi:MAG: RluA family pseudouridine synthase [Rikenellaceae bacterium]|nr:RluA family pseudouridine synthase [Rikenellaceae bacterium]